MKPANARAAGLLTEVQARQFVSDWLWRAPKRYTSGLPWSEEHVRDAALMLLALQEAQDRKRRKA